MTEEDLVKGLQAAEEAAFRHLVETYQKQVFNTCHSFVHNRSDADDLTQEVFIEIYRSSNNFRGSARLSTWIYRIAVNKSLNHLRRQKRNSWLRFPEDILKRQNNRLDSVRDETSPSDDIEKRERLHQIHQAIDRLPENQRIAFLLSKTEDLPGRQIADIMHTSVTAVDSLIFRAKANLQKNLYSLYKKNVI